MKIQNGTLLNDRYRVLSLIGEGGYSYVYKIEDVCSNAIYALKQTSIISRNIISQLNAQANLLMRLKHKNFSVVRDYFSDGSFFYIVSDFIEGQDLRRYVLENGAMSIEMSLRVIVQIAQAVDFLHNSQSIPILHRDIKPANIIINNNQEAFLVDFGLMKIDKGQETETIARAFTRGYSPIEQYEKEKTSVQSDIYSLGATLYFLLSGIDPQESISRIRTDHMPAAFKRIPEIPAFLIKILLNAMAITPESRYKKIGAFLLDIEKQLNEYKKDKALQSTQLMYLPEKTVKNDLPTNLRLNLAYQILDDGVCENVLSWGNANNVGSSFRLVRKYFILPRNSTDGDWWDVSNSPFVDKDVENGKLVFYSLYLDDILLGSTSGIRMDEVCELSAERNNKEIILSFRLPQNTKSIIKKSYTQFPSNVLDGLEVISKPVINYDGLVTVKEEEDCPVFYTIFCRYLKARSVFVTSLGRKVYA